MIGSLDMFILYSLDVWDSVIVFAAYFFCHSKKKKYFTLTELVNYIWVVLHCYIQTFVPNRQLSSVALRSAWLPLPYITSNISAHQFDWQIPSLLPSILHCSLNIAEVKGHLHPLSPGLCAGRDSCNWICASIHSSVKVWETAQSPCPVAPFASGCPWGTWVNVLMTCHTVFITVTCLFMAASNRSGPAVDWAISPVSPFLLFIYVFISHYFSTHPTFPSLFFLTSLSFPAVLVIFLTHPPTLSTHNIIASLLVLSSRPPLGGCINVTDLTSNWSQRGMGLALADFVTFDKRACGWMLF